MWKTLTRNSSNQQRYRFDAPPGTVLDDLIFVKFPDGLVLDPAHYTVEFVEESVCEFRSTSSVPVGSGHTQIKVQMPAKRSPARRRGE